MPEKSQRTLQRKILLWIIFLFLSIAIPFLLIESAGRIYIHYKHGVPGKSYGLWRYDKDLGAIHRENAYNTNAQTNDFGFRNVERVLEPKPDGAIRIIAYGGSTTYSYNLGNDEAWPLQLQSTMRMNRNQHDQVLNGGAILWSIGHAYARAKKDLPLLKPDYVLIYSGINETTNSGHLRGEGKPLNRLVEEGKYGEFAKTLDQNRWAKRNLVSVRYLDYKLKKKFRKARKKNVSADEQAQNNTPNTKNETRGTATMENYLAVLHNFIELIQAHGGQPVFIVQARGNDSALLAQITSFSAAGAPVAEELGAIVIDARELVNNHEGDPMDLFYKTGVHYSKSGSTMLAQFIFDELF